MTSIKTILRRIKAEWFTKSAWIGTDPRPTSSHLDAQDPTFEASAYVRRGGRV